MIRNLKRAIARATLTVVATVSLISCNDQPPTPKKYTTTETETLELTSQLPVELIKEVRLPTGLMYENTELGGLSGITYDEKNQLYYAISDDRSQKSAARFYTLKIDVSSAKVLPEIAVTTLLNESKQVFAPGSLDPEAIALTGRDTVWIASEGDRSGQIFPFIKEFSLNGELLNILPIPEKFIPDLNNNQGVRNNLSLESLTVTPDRTWLFAGTENALIQDGLSADINQGSPCRIVKYNLLAGRPETEFLYLTEPVADRPNPPDSFHTNGLVELLAIDETHLLSLERSYSNGIGNTILLFEVSLENSTDIQDINSLSEANIDEIRPAEKRLLLDLRSLNIPLDNIEGMTFGPVLPDGRRSLILISDNNFNPLQVTQILILAISKEFSPQKTQALTTNLWSDRALTSY